MGRLWPKILPGLCGPLERPRLQWELLLGDGNLLFSAPELFPKMPKLVAKPENLHAHRKNKTDICIMVFNGASVVLVDKS